MPEQDRHVSMLSWLLWGPRSGNTTTIAGMVQEQIHEHVPGPGGNGPTQEDDHNVSKSMDPVVGTEDALTITSNTA